MATPQSGEPATVPRNFYFTGKGGVGKTTLATLTALHLAAQGLPVALISLDPAHNLGDVLQQPVNSQLQTFDKHFWACEVDSQEWKDRYLQGIQQEMEDRYSYYKAFSLKSYFHLLKHSPSADEQALFLAIKQLQTHHQHIQHFVFDMPPTGLALRFFGLPGTSLQWLHELIQLRATINEKQGLVADIRKQARPRDKTLARLHELLTRYKKAQANLQEAAIQLVTTPDPLARAEGVRIKKALQAYDLAVHTELQNKSPKGQVVRHSPDGLIQVPESPALLSGLQQLKAFSQQVSQWLLPETGAGPSKAHHQSDSDK